MRLTLRSNRWAQAAMLAAWVFSSGCQRHPYINQSKTVPHDAMGKMALEDKEIKQADFLSSNLPVQMPKVAKPRTTENPEAEEIWPMTLQEAVRIGLDNAEVVRVIDLGAQGIPIEGFEPRLLGVATVGGGSAIGQPVLGVGVGSSVLGGGQLATVYDPAIQEVQIAKALSTFDAALTTNLSWGKNTQPFNNAIQGGSFGFAGPKTPIISVQDSATYQFGLQKRTATGAQVSIVHNINWLYQNSTFLTTPSVYTTNLQMSLTQPLLGSAPMPGQGAGPPVGLEANRAPIVIARLTADESVWNFKLQVLELVRSVEQQYWILARKHVQLWASEKAVELAREIVNREQAELVVGKGTVADVAEAKQRLEQFGLEFVTRTSDVINIERQFRNLLGLPPADGRRIVPVTPPTEARLEPDWESSLAQMLSFYPDIVRQQLIVRIAELSLLIARNELLPQLSLNLLYQLNGLGQQLDSAEAVMTGATIKALEPVVAARERAAGLASNPGFYNNFRTWQVGLSFQMPLGMRHSLADVRFAQYGLLRQRAQLQQVVHQRTHQLARFFLEVDANYKQYKTASRLREAASERLEAQRAYYEEGKITIDRFLDAVSQYATAVATEAEYKTLYNISIVLLEESKGTLLAYNNIAVSEGPHPPKAYVQARNIQDGHKQHSIPHDGPMYPERVGGPINPDPVAPKPPAHIQPEEPAPPLPAPGGTLGPAPTPVPPFHPATDPGPLSRNGVPRMIGNPLGDQAPTSPARLTSAMPRRDTATIPTGGDSAPAFGSVATPTARSVPNMSPRAPEPRPSTAPPPESNTPPPDDLPMLPDSIELPPLPPRQ